MIILKNENSCYFKGTEGASRRRHEMQAEGMHTPGINRTQATATAGQRVLDRMAMCNRATTTGRNSPKRQFWTCLARLELKKNNNNTYIVTEKFDAPTFEAHPSL